MTVQSRVSQPRHLKLLWGSVHALSLDVTTKSHPQTLPNHSVEDRLLKGWVWWTCHGSWSSGGLSITERAMPW